jgi:hypothetical protein
MMRRIVLIAIVLAGVFSCKKKYDLPPPLEPLPVSGYIKIDSITKTFLKYYLPASGPAPSKQYRFSTDVNLECTVTADESSSNIYKTVYVEDATGALQIKLLEAGGLAAGDKIRINLKNVILNDYSSVIQLDSVNLQKNVVKISSGNPVTPTKVTFNQLLALKSYTSPVYSGTLSISPYQSRLVTVDTVEFSAGDKNKPYADFVGKNSVDRYLNNAFGSSIVVRTSGYAGFASELTPCGLGKFTAVVSQYNQDLQFIIRNYSEVQLASNGCPVLVSDFEDGNIYANGWTNYAIATSTMVTNWKAGNYGGRNYMECWNKVGSTNYPADTWFISPVLDIATAANPHFSFESAANYAGAALQVKVSNDYVSGDPNSGTWTTLNPVLSSGSFVWKFSGNISLNLYKTTATRIAFRYTGSSTDGSRWEVDNIAIFRD